MVKKEDRPAILFFVSKPLVEDRRGERFAQRVVAVGIGRRAVAVADSRMFTGSTFAGRANSSRTASGLNMQIHSVSRFSDAAASIMWSVTIDASMSEMFLPSYLRVHASEVSAQTMTAVGAPKSRVQRARRSMPSFDCTTTSRWGWRLAPVGATRPASRISSSFSGSTCLERYLRQAYRFFASFRKSICKGFNYIKVRTGRAIRNLPTGKKGRYASKGIKIRAVIQPGAPFWQVRLTEWQKKSTGTPFVAGRAGNQIQQQR